MIVSTTSLVFTNGSVGGGLGAASTNGASGDDFNGLLAGLGSGGDFVPNSTPPDSNDRGTPPDREDVPENGASRDVTSLATRAADTTANTRGPSDTTKNLRGSVRPQTDTAPEAPAAKAYPLADVLAKATTTKAKDGKRAEVADRDPATETTTANATPAPGKTPPDFLLLLTSSVAGGAPAAAAAAASGLVAAEASAKSAPLRGGRVDDQTKAGDQPSAIDASSQADVSLPTDVSPILLSRVKVENYVAPAVGTGPAQIPAAGGPDPKSIGTAKPNATTAPPSRPDEPAVQAHGVASATTASATTTNATTASATAQLDGTALPPTRAIANAVANLASEAAAVSDASAVPDDVTGAVPSPARTLTLQLSPANLGSVNIRLHVSGQTLDVEISLSDHETLGMVSRERDTLASALRDQSYDLHSLVIQGADAATFASGDQNAQFQNSGGGSAAADGRPSAREGGGTGQGGESGGSNREARSGEPRAPDTATKRGGDALFV